VLSRRWKLGVGLAAGGIWASLGSAAARADVEPL
jgi:hypothetical protein